ncbi:serine protease [Oscillatoria amoena NRMC-F 0135]|uniref:Serine protease n=1 Tax=Geitlerinema calcuttense NRMC-F 0142 TaxID=2922238 RepID=A0ABT7LWC8_9CYAN|nr:serine protease [Geitlerinema calcuttense]MCD8488467.1 serine protease [Desertifilum sp.]MDL5045179.1 serine protease [Oscillatoria amoena NRMC-F 0135]MDL5056336.1 serine protease [Geitlerinema calcuttense NRMC-F 0142]
MRFYQPLLASGLVGAVVVMTANSVKANALLPTEVADIARSTVVQIQSTIAAPGSGVIIGRYQERGRNVYVVLTAAHVVQHSDDAYSIITPLPTDGSASQRKQRQRIAIEPRDIQKLPNLDLAIVRFKSDRAYKTATLGDSDYTTEGAGVYIAGFPNPGEAIQRRVFQFTSSLVSSRLDQEIAVEGEESSGPLPGGYALVYTNITRAGMSGGPVFDVAGRVVGIHGMGDGEQIVGTDPNARPGQEAARAARTINLKTGFNLGIPIQSFLEAMPNARRNLSLNFDRSAPGVLPGGGLIALRGGQSQPVTNIVEEEDPANDVVVEGSQPMQQAVPTQPQPARSPAASPQPAPQAPAVPTQPAPTPAPATGGGPFF